MKPFRTEKTKNKKTGEQFLAECYGMGVSKIKVVLTDDDGKRKMVGIETYLRNYERV